MSEPGTPSPDHIASLNEQIDRAIAEAATWRDHSDPTVIDKPLLQFMEAVLGPIMTLPDGRQIEDAFAWIDVPAEPRAVFYAALHLLRGIRAHGSGRVWWLAPTPNGKVVHMVDSYGPGSTVLKGADGGDCVRLRSVYFHEALAKGTQTTDLVEEIVAAVARGVTEVRLHPATFKRLVGYTGAKVTYTNGEPAQGMTLLMSTRSGPVLIATDPDCTIDYVCPHEIPANDRNGTVNVGDAVELNSGGLPMAVIEIATPGHNEGGTDIVAWWRSLDGKPQILEIDSRCVRKSQSADRTASA